MKKISVVCAPGIGDALIFHIASHHLALAGYEVTTVTPHDFGKWIEGRQSTDLVSCDAIFLQNDNSERAKEIHASGKEVYTFYGSHHLAKHGPLRMGFDYVCDQNKNMVQNVRTALKLLFQISASSDNGIHPLQGLVHRRHAKRVVLHPVSAQEEKNWPRTKFEKVAAWLGENGYEPVFLPHFPTLEELFSFIYESGYFIGNDSGPGHIASCLQVPHLIIGPHQRQMSFWKPGWLKGEMVVAPNWIPKQYWKTFITTKDVIKSLKSNVLKIK